MLIDIRKAARICTEKELALVETARGEALRSLSPRRLDVQIARARGLRDRLRDLADRQRRGAKGRVAARSDAGTVEKEKLFGEVLRRFEGRARMLRGSEAPLLRSRSAAKAKRRTEPRSNRPTRRRSAAAMPVRKKRQLAKSQVPRVHAHAGSRNRRLQGRRDAR
jgi:hypothetical protein